MENAVAGHWVIYTDGASRGNPGLAGAGVYMIAPDESEHRYHKFLGEKTNNQAEYEALIFALEQLQDKADAKLIIRADSELMIKQLKGIYRVKNPNMIPLFQQIQTLIKPFSSVSYEHVRRNFNKEADAEANLAIDEHNFAQ